MVELDIGRLGDRSDGFHSVMGWDGMGRGENKREKEREKEKLCGEGWKKPKSLWGEGAQRRLLSMLHKQHLLFSPSLLYGLDEYSI